MAFITPPESIFHDSYLFAHDLHLFTLLGNLFTFLNNQIIYQTTLQNQWVSSLPYPLCYLCCLEWFSKLRDSCFSAESNLPWFQISPCSSVQRPLVPYWEYKLEGLSPCGCHFQVVPKVATCQEPASLQPLWEVWGCLCQSSLPLSTGAAENQLGREPRSGKSRSTQQP